MGKTREVYVCMTLQICQRARRAVALAVGLERTKLAIPPVPTLEEHHRNCISREAMMFVAWLKLVRLELVRHLMDFIPKLARD